MWEHTKEEEERDVLALGGHSFIAITSCNRLLVLDFFSILEVEHTDPWAVAPAVFSLSMLDRGWCWLFLQPRNRCWVWEIYSACEGHEGLKMGYLVVWGSWFGISLHVTYPQLKWRTFDRNGWALHENLAACHWLVAKTMDLELNFSDVVFSGEKFLRG